MSHWRSGTFWASAIFGWFVTMFILAWLIWIIFGSMDLTETENIIIAVGHQLLALAAGYSYGRRQFEIRKPPQPGFPVIMKDDHEPGAS